MCFKVVFVFRRFAISSTGLLLMLLLFMNMLVCLISAPWSVNCNRFIWSIDRLSRIMLASSEVTREVDAQGAGRPHNGEGKNRHRRHRYWKRHHQRRRGLTVEMLTKKSQEIRLPRDWAGVSWWPWQSFRGSFMNLTFEDELHPCHTTPTQGIAI